MISCITINYHVITSSFEIFLAFFQIARVPQRQASESRARLQAGSRLTASEARTVHFGPRTGAIAKDRAKAGVGGGVGVWHRVRATE